MVEILWVGRSKNEKTGDIPQAFVGTSRQECAATCKAVGCKLLPKKWGGEGAGEDDCYAHNGRVSIASVSVHKAFKKARQHYREMLGIKDPTRKERARMKQLKGRYSLEEAIAKSVRSAKMVRFTAIGDGGVKDRAYADQVMDTLSKHRMELLGFTRHWISGKADHWKGRLMASCFSLEEADKAVRMGWRASVVLPADQTEMVFKTPDGVHGVVCPYIQGKAVNCNTCGMCVASRNGPIIGFPSHQ